MHTFITLVRTFLVIIIDWCFPADPPLRAIEAMEPADFLARARRPLDNPPRYIRSLFQYHDPFVQTALWSLKYNGNTRIADLFGSLVYDYQLEELSDARLFLDFTQPLIIPLPLSRERFKERGWNQSEMIARALKKRDKNNSFEISITVLSKIRHTLPQTRLSKAERLTNLAGCFKVSNSDTINGRNIILIDDVVTTGSTIEEARQTLLKAGARQVIAITIAH